MRWTAMGTLTLVAACGGAFEMDGTQPAEDGGDGTVADDDATGGGGDDDSAPAGDVDDAFLVSIAFPAALACGQPSSGAVVMLNSGTTTWTRDGGYKLGGVGDEDPLVIGDVRVWLDEGVSVLPGGQHTFTVPVEAGDGDLGSLLTDWQMVREGVHWFGAQGVAVVEGTCDGGGGQTGWTCIESVRNGSEICDDQAFSVPSPYEPMVLVCESATGGIGYVSTGTGPPMDDGVSRCQGWEEDGLNAWDYLDYIVQVECAYDGQTVEVDLSPWQGQGLWVGSHDHPSGGGHMNQVCIATWN